MVYSLTIKSFFKNKKQNHQYPTILWGVIVFFCKVGFDYL